MKSYSHSLFFAKGCTFLRMQPAHPDSRIGEGVLSQRISYENIGQLRKFLLERSLFDNKLFQSDTILTSTSIQRRFQLAVKSRASKNPVVVNPKFWLLSKEETQSFIKMHPILNNSEKNPRYSEKNPSYSENYDIKKSKENVSRRSSKGEGRNFAVFCVKDNRRQKVLPKQMEQICTFILTVL